MMDGQGMKDWGVGGGVWIEERGVGVGAGDWGLGDREGGSVDGEWGLGGEELGNGWKNVGVVSDRVEGCFEHRDAVGGMAENEGNREGAGFKVCQLLERYGTM